MRNTLQYILKKLLFMIPMVLVITFLIYGGLELTPGDAISHMIPPDQLANVDPSQLEALRQAYGLNDPFLLRYLRWLWELLHGNFGYSITSGVPIKDILIEGKLAILFLLLAHHSFRRSQSFNEGRTRENSFGVLLDRHSGRRKFDTVVVQTPQKRGKCNIQHGELISHEVFLFCNSRC